MADKCIYSMDEISGTRLHDFHVASRKAEEAALRRYEAAGWLEAFVGPLGIPVQPSEREFISCLRNGKILCNAVNRIHPGAVPKVVENHFPPKSLPWEPQPLPAYQYFENVKNFIVAVEDLKLPAFEASVLERDNLDAGSVSKVVDCILALKSYHEVKHMGGRNDTEKHIRSPLVSHSTSKIYARPLAAISTDSCRHLDMSRMCEKQNILENELHRDEGSVINALFEGLIDAKENINHNIQSSFGTGKLDAVRLVSEALSSCLEEQLLGRSPAFKTAIASVLKEKGSAQPDLSSGSLKERSSPIICKCCRSCLKNGIYKHKFLLRAQEKKLLDLKDLVSSTRREYEDLQFQLQQGFTVLASKVQQLSVAALGYQKVVQENRELYNMVMDLKGNIRVYCRVRPTLDTGVRTVVDYIGQDGSLAIQDPSKFHNDGRKLFQFNRVFGQSATQDEVFKDTQPLIRSVMDGYNVCIFAYGQTGSGKTYTMSGPSYGSTKDAGINYLALNDLFQISSNRKNFINYDIRVQMVEIYNEQVRDLLSEDSACTKLEVRGCNVYDGLNVPEATICPVSRAADVLDLMKLGDMNRAVSSTAMNNRSSRSHSVLTVHVHGKDKSGSTLSSCLHLVDLAGSERVDKSEVTGERLKEAQYINKSLSCLGDVITALAQKSPHIPYRNSKLTLLLQDSLGGQAKTLMFAHVSPEECSIGETVSTLKFAQRVSTIELGAARMNKETSEIMELKVQVENLKTALVNRESKIPQPRAGPEIFGAVCSEDNKGSTMKSARNSRRSSLEGPKYAKNITKQVEPGSAQKYEQMKDTEAASKLQGFHSPNQNAVSRRESVESITPHKLPTTPKRSLLARNGVKILMQSEITCSVDMLTPTPPSVPNTSTGGKKSHIRSSIRSIGKLINSSEKRNQQYGSDVRSSVTSKIATSVNDDKSPMTARALRRQSLAGIQTSRRSSLGGKTDSYADQHRNARTPPSSKMQKQWL